MFFELFRFREAVLSIRVIGLRKNLKRNKRFQLTINWIVLFSELLHHFLRCNTVLKKHIFVITVVKGFLQHFVLIWGGGGCTPGYVTGNRRELRLTQNREQGGNTDLVSRKYFCWWKARVLMHHSLNDSSWGAQYFKPKRLTKLWGELNLVQGKKYRMNLRNTYN